MRRIITLALFLALLGLAPHTSAAGTADAAADLPAADTTTILLDLNTAGYDDLLSVRGIGPSLAGRILDYRAAHGSFSRIEQLLEVKGIGESSLSHFRKYLTLSTPPSPVATGSPTTPR